MPIHNQFIRDASKEPNPVGLRVLGAYFHIEVHVPPQIAEAMVQAGQSVPSPVPGVALIDTGATVTCVEETILQRLGLHPFDVVSGSTANGPVQQRVYPGRIVFPTKGWTMDLGGVVGVNLSGQFVQERPPQPIIALLGRTFLERGTFIYGGIGGFWSFAID